jgi:hypothetical protein
MCQLSQAPVVPQPGLEPDPDLIFDLTKRILYILALVVKALSWGAVDA